MILLLSLLTHTSQCEWAVRKVRPTLEPLREETVGAKQATSHFHTTPSLDRHLGSFENAKRSPAPIQMPIRQHNYLTAAPFLFLYASLNHMAPRLSLR